MKEKDKLQFAQWSDLFDRWKGMNYSAINKISPTRSFSLDDDFAAFKNAMESLADESSERSIEVQKTLRELPELLERLRAYPKSNVKEGRRIYDCEVKALEAYINACLLGLKWSQELDNRPLEAAMFFRFTQAHKWWDVVSRLTSEFWNDLTLRAFKP